VASAKRRTLPTLFLFTCHYNASNNMPSFASNVLADVLAPESKALWQASDRASWVAEYNRHLAEWPDGMVVMGEFWRSPEAGSEQKSGRIERWLRSADEFGMMLLAVTAHLRGC
jgi:hypothetical protein